MEARTPSLAASDEGNDSMGEILLEGWLLKRGAKRKNWKVRWFEKRGDKLVYSIAKDKTDKGFISLHDVLSVSEDHTLIRKSTSLISMKRERTDSKEKEAEINHVPQSLAVAKTVSAHKRGGSSVNLLAPTTSVGDIDELNSSGGAEDGGDDEDENEKKKRAQYDKGFQIETEKRTYYLMASSDKEREKWTKGINYHTKRLRDKSNAAEKLASTQEALRLAQKNERAAREEAARLESEQKAAFEEEWKRREEELKQKFKRKKKQLRKKIKDKEHEISDSAYAEQLLTSQRAVPIPESTPPRPEADQSLRELVETLQSKLEEHQELILYQKNIIKDLEKEKLNNERLAINAEKKTKKIEREYQRTIKREIRAKAAAIKSPTESSAAQASITSDDESEDEVSSGIEDNPSESTDDSVSKKEEWDEDDDDDELVEILDSQQTSESIQADDEYGDSLADDISEAENDKEDDSEDVTENAQENQSQNESVPISVREGKYDQARHSDTDLFSKPTVSGRSWQPTSSKESFLSGRLSTSLTRQKHGSSKSLSFSEQIAVEDLRSPIGSAPGSSSPLSMSCAVPKSKPPVPPRRRMENWMRGNTEDLKRHKSRAYSILEHADEAPDERWDRPDRKKRTTLIKKLQSPSSQIQLTPPSLIKSMVPSVVTSPSLTPAALSSAFSGRGTVLAKASTSDVQGTAGSQSQQITLKLVCQELGTKTKAIRVDFNTTIDALLKRKPLANWTKKLQMKRAKETKDQLSYALFLPIARAPPLPAEISPGVGRKSDLLIKGIWLAEDSPLWKYDLDEGTTLELKCIETAKYTNDIGNNYVIQILYSINGDSGASNDRTNELFKFNKYTPVRDVMTTAILKLQTDCDVEHYGLLLHKRSGTVWLNPDNILAAYHLQDMDILELRKRYMELCLEDGKVGDSPRGLLVPSAAQGRLLLDPSTMSVLEATHSICNWLGIAQSRWEHYGMLASMPPEPPAWLQEGQSLAHYALPLDAIVELQPKTIFGSPESESATIDSTTYTLIVKFSPHSSQQEEVGNEGSTITDKKSEEMDATLSRFCVGGEVGRQRLDGVGLVMPNQLVVGTIYCTNYALMFNPRALAVEGVRIPLCSIWRISKVAKTTLMVHCKDFRPNIRFRFASKNLARHWHQILHQNAFPVQIEKTFAFDFKWEGINDGWHIYNVQEEYKRQFSLAGKLGKRWRLSDINKDYRMSATYPEYIGVPTQMLDEVLPPIFEFRSKGRIPALSYLFRNGASITRSSQPMVGFRGNSCPQDEYLLEAIFRANPMSEKKSSVLRIYDARPRVNAMANQAMGAGVEKCGPNSRLDFLNIGNIHVMRESYNKLNQLCIFDTSLSNSPNSSSSSSSFPLSAPSGAPTPISASWLSNLERTKWLDHLSLILTAATNVALCVYKQTSVLIHCSDGWDRTPQISALAQLMLDKYYRSIRGFAVLLEKEFLSFGHKFQERYGHAHPDDAGTSQRAPIFPQFLDLVYQLTVQFPCAFEFNERFLIFLLEHLYDCQFGTFLCNSQKERMDLRLPEKTISIWSYIINKTHKKFDFVNPFYMPEIDVFFPDTGVESLVLWKGFYFRHTMKFGNEDYKLVTRYAKQVTVELRAMQLINTIEALNEKLKEGHAKEATDERGGA